MPEFIVAEVSKTWRGRRQHKYPQPAAADCLCGRFEHVIERNRQRGYELHSFDLSQVMTGEDELTETIIAVFRRKEPV